MEYLLVFGLIAYLIFRPGQDSHGSADQGDDERIEDGEGYDDSFFTSPFTYSPMDRPMSGWGEFSSKEVYHQTVYEDDD